MLPCFEQLARLLSPLRSHLPTFGCLVAVGACGVAAPPVAPPGPSVTLMGVSAPERVPGYVAFAAHRLEDAAYGVTFMYTPPLDADPGITLRVYPLPDSASGTYVRDQFVSELGRMARPRPAGPQPQIEPARAITIVGTDGVSYEGWRSTSGTPGSRSLNHLYVFEKEAHGVRYNFMDDGLDPVVTEAGAEAFIASTIGELAIGPPSREEVAARPVAPGPPENPFLRPTPLPPPYVTASDDVLEAVARWAFQNAETDLDPPGAYCLALGAPDADPSGPFLARFTDVAVPVRPVSECYLLAGGPPRATLRRHSVVDPVSGQFALAFHLLRITWTSVSAAEAGVLYLQGQTWGGGWSCRVDSNEPGEWQVSECQRTVDY